MDEGNVLETGSGKPKEAVDRDSRKNEGHAQSWETVGVGTK